MYREEREPMYYYLKGWLCQNGSQILTVLYQTSAWDRFVMAEPSKAVGTSGHKGIDS